MEWRDEGVLLAVRKHGEGSAIVEVFTADHGRHAGVVRGGASRKMAPHLQPGTQLSVAWRARLEEHLGAFTVEPLRSRMGDVLGDRPALAGLNAMASLISYAMPEREPHPKLYHHTVALMDALGAGDHWHRPYVRWEVALLRELGFGLDLKACAVSGTGEDLAHVSPRSGRAVSRAVGAGWEDRLLPLPEFLWRENEPRGRVSDGLRMTGHFLLNWLAPALGKADLPPARERLVRVLEREEHAEL